MDRAYELEELRAAEDRLLREREEVTLPFTARTTLVPRGRG